MKRILLLFSLFIFSLPHVASQDEMPQPSLKPSPHDLVFDQLAGSWDEGIPLGKSMMGALVWSQTDQSSELAVVEKDWLIESPKIRAEVHRTDKEVILTNGLVSRTIRLAPNAATVGLKNLVTGEEFIRSVKPEALVSIDGTSYPIGGLMGQKEHGYLK